MKKDTNKPTQKFFCPIKPSTKPLYKDNIYGFDIETDPLKKNIFICACITNGKDEYVFYTTDTLLEFILTDRKMRSVLFIATNLAYDFFGSFLLETGIMDIFERKNTLYAIKLHQSDGRHVATFKDTYRYYPASVESLGEFLKMPKLKDPRRDEHGEYTYGLPRNVDEMKALTNYCLMDALISYRFYVEIVHTWCAKNCIIPGLSNTSNAIKLFRTYYLTHTWIPHTHEMNTKIRLAYYGGRVEAFTRGIVHKVDHYDINSLYPYCMTKVYPFPNSVKHLDKGTIRHILDYEGVSFVQVFIARQRIAPLPFKHNGQLLFATGYVSGYYTHVELRETLVYGVEILSVGETFYYEKVFYPFTKWVPDLYKQRMEKKAAGNSLEIMDKLMLNGLYGRFGMDYSVVDSIISQKQFDPMDYIEYDQVQELKHGYYRVTQTDCSDVPCFAFPIIAAYVTSYGRLELLHKMKMYEKDILYCDTDSIFIRHDAGTYPTSNDLGDLKAEHGKEPYASVTFVRSKTYAINKTKSFVVKWKGMKQIKTEKDFNEILTTQKTVETRLLKIRSYLNIKPHHKKADIPINAPYTQEKFVDLEDKKRLWPKKFNRTTHQDSLPIHFHSEPKSI